MTQLFTPLFTSALVRDLRALPGAGHSYVKQLCAPGAAQDRLREQLDTALALLPSPLQSLCAERLSSLDNRRFFQGLAELATARTLQLGAWKLAGPSMGGFQAIRPDGHAVNVLVLSMLHASDMGLDRARVATLEQALGRISARTRFVVSVRRWLPQGFDPAPVRQAVDLWLREVEAGRWKTRYAAYEDESVSLEFGLVGELDSPLRTRSDNPAPLITLGPFGGAKAMTALESKLIRALDQLRLSPEGHQPVVVSVVGERPWAIAPGTLQAFFYGKPRWTQTSWEPGVPDWEACLSREAEPCLYKDALYDNVLGTLLMHRSDTAGLYFGGEVWSNPFASIPLAPAELPLPSIAAYSTDEDRPVLRRFPGRSPISLATISPAPNPPVS